jgi:hypothetical protein
MFCESSAQIAHNAHIGCAQESCTKLKGAMVNTGEFLVPLRTVPAILTSQGR